MLPRSHRGGGAGKSSCAAFDAVPAPVLGGAETVALTNLYALLGGWTTDLVDSDTLGEAFEPEQRFENPDGSAIFFDTDFAGGR